MKKKLLWPVVFIVVFALSRWPGLMPPNFSVVYAILFCAGFYLPGRLGWIVPLGVVAGSDIFLNLYYNHGAFSPARFVLDEAPVFLAYAGLILLGRVFAAKRSWRMLLGGGLLWAILFYIVTNTMAWLSSPHYAKTLAGWIQAITVGLPGYPPTWQFFRNTLISGGLFSGLFAAAMKLTESSESSESAEEKEKEEKEPTPDPEGEPAKAKP